MKNNDYYDWRGDHRGSGQWNWGGGNQNKGHLSVAPIVCMFILAFDFSVDKQHHNRTDNRYDETAEVETINFTKPKKVLIQPPTTAPTTPKIMVIKNPPPSLPGIIHFAKIPAIRPKTTHEIMPIIFLTYVLN